MRRSRVYLTAFVLIASTALAQSKSDPTSSHKNPKPELIVEAGHGNWISGLTPSSDGKLLASISKEEGTVKIWEVASGMEVKTLRGLSHPNCAAFSPDGRRLVVASEELTLWDLVTTESRNLAESPGHPFTSIAFSKDGRWLAAGSDTDLRLWDLRQGGDARVWTGQVYAVAFSPDGLRLASSDDQKISIRNVVTGRQSTLKMHNPLSSPTSLMFSKDGGTLFIGANPFSLSSDPIAIAEVHSWDLKTGHVTSMTLPSEPGGVVTSMAFGAYGDLVATIRVDSIKIWEIATSRLLQEINEPYAIQAGVAFGPEGRWVASADYETIHLWDTSTKSQSSLVTIAPHHTLLDAVALSKDGEWLAESVSVGDEFALKLWNLKNGREVLNFPRNPGSRPPGWDFLDFGPNNKTLLTKAISGVRLWNLATGTFKTLPLEKGESPMEAALSPNGYEVAVASILDSPSGRKRTIKHWNASTGELRGFSGQHYAVNSLAFSRDGTKLVAANQDSTASIWDVSTGQEVDTFNLIATGAKKEDTWDTRAQFTEDGNFLIIVCPGDGIWKWDIAAHKKVFQFDSFSPSDPWGAQVELSQDGHTLAASYHNGDVRLWETATGQQLPTIHDAVGGAGLLLSLSSLGRVAFTSNGCCLVSATDDGIVHLWDIRRGEELAKMVTFENGEWAVVDSAGRFDASDGGMKLLHWTVGLEVIELQQLKERYYDPGLLAKVFGESNEPLRDVETFDKVALFPAVKTETDRAGKLHIRLSNRGGGIGKVQVLVNGKEFLSDARGKGTDSSAAETELIVDPSRAPAFHGGQNNVEIISWNQTGSVSSRGTSSQVIAPSSGTATAPELYVIAAGISDYASPALQLNFAAADADEVSLALKLAGTRLFGADKVHLMLFSTSGRPDTLPPTKTNLQRAFEAMQKSRPNDVLVVYLAGHGVTVRSSFVRGIQEGTYAYPTAEARTLDFVDPAILARSAITVDELEEWVAKIPATHQAIILDTCAAGAAAQKLLTKRAMSGDQIRAIEGLRDRFGFYVLMGSASDAVSYETSQYGQGLLTYSLLEGMKGAALQNDKDVDVDTLFKYAANTVPELAKNIGGIQKPQVMSRPGGTFVLGQLLTQDKKAIPLSMPLPLILRPTLLNPDENEDNLGLMKVVREQLRDLTYSVRGKLEVPQAVFVDGEELPGAITPSGTYTVVGKNITVKLLLKRENQRKTAEIDGNADDIQSFGGKVAQKIIELARQF